MIHAGAGGPRPPATSPSPKVRALVRAPPRQTAAAADAERMADAIRFLAVDAILQAGEGHQGVPLGMAEIATALYTRHLAFDPADPTWPDRDRVVLLKRPPARCCSTPCWR